MISLGREPQVHETKTKQKPRSGGRKLDINGCSSRCSPDLSPLRGSL